MAKIALDDLAGARPGRVWVRIVIGPHAVVYAPPGEVVPTNRVVEKGRRHLLGEILARLSLDGYRVAPQVSMEVVIPLLDVERDPSDLVFNRDQLEARVAIEDPIEDKFEDCVSHIQRLQVHTHPIALLSRVAPDHALRRSVLVVAVPSDDVEAQRHVE